MDNNKKTEGDINSTPARSEWSEQLDAETKKILEKDARFFLHQSMSTPCLDVLKNCEGPHIESIWGKKYLDFHGNNVHQIGFSHPRLVQRITEQLHTLSFSTRRYTNLPAIAFAEKLASLAPSDLNRVLLTPNGSSAVGIALKLARAITGKHKVISFWDSFHGASLDAVSVGGESVFRDKMGPLMPGTLRVPPPVTYRGIFEDDENKSLEYLAYVLSKENGVGAFIAETIRNTDVQIPSIKYWQAVRKLCDQYGVLLILDEIPIGLGRTGKMFAFEHYNIEPDILCLGKGLGGGIFPQAAVITRDKYNKLGDISLGHYTHEKSPIGSTAGLSTLEIIEEEHLLEKTGKHAQYIRTELGKLKKKYSIIGDVRGIGLLWGVELVKDRKSKKKAIGESEEVMYSCLHQGLNFKVSAGNVLQLSPPLTIKKEELKIAIDILDKSLSKIEMKTK